MNKELSCLKLWATQCTLLRHFYSYLAERCSRQIINADGITLHLHGKRKTAQCPECFKRSDSAHSCRRCKIQHPPCSGQTLWLVFSVRHWYCRNPACSRKIFVGALVPFASSHQQSSQVLQNLQRQPGLIAGDEAGKRAATGTRVHEIGSAELRRVAAGMEADAAAICEAISSRWSNGVVGGHVNLA